MQLGVAYKPDTNVVEDSQGFIIAQKMAQDERRVLVFDLYAMDNARRVLNHSVQYAASLDESIGCSDALIVANPCREFRDLKVADIAPGKEPLIVFDFWRILQAEFRNCDWISYHPIGFGGADSTRLARISSIWSYSR